MQNSIYKIKYLLFLSWDWEAWCLTVWGGKPPPERNTAWNKGRKCFHCLGAPNNLIRPCVWLLSFLTSELNGRWVVNFRPRPLYLWDRNPVPFSRRLDVLEKRKISYLNSIICHIPPIFHRACWRVAECLGLWQASRQKVTNNVGQKNDVSYVRECVEHKTHCHFQAINKLVLRIYK